MITLIKGFKYDNRYDYAKTFTNKAEQEAYFNSLYQINITDENYIKEHLSFKVGYNYDWLVSQGINYVIFNNGYKNIYAFITSKEYVSEDVTRINFEVDVIQTYLFDFNIKKSFVERKVCNIEEITEFDEGIEFGEHYVATEEVVYSRENYYFAMFTGFKTDIKIEEGGELKNIVSVPSAINRPLTDIDGVKYPLAFLPLSGLNASVFSTYLQDHASLVGILVTPKCTFEQVQAKIPILYKNDEGEVKGTEVPVALASNIKSIEITGKSITVPKGNITDFYPYSYYVLTDGESEPLLMHPQNCKDTITIKGKCALSHSPVERFYPSYYKGDTQGRIYNITNSTCTMLPVGQNTGLEYLTANSNAIQSEKVGGIANIISATFGAVVGTAVGTMSGGVVGGAVSAMNGASQMSSAITTVYNQMARINDLEATPSSIKSYGSPSTRMAFGTNNVRLLKYTIQDKYKERISNFTSRYGNKYNNYATIDLKSYKGFIKFNSPDLDSNIDFDDTLKIISILERGIYVE